MFTTKAFIVPHLKMIICGTGMGGFLGRWFIVINDRMVVKDIDHLDYHTPKGLLSLWRSYVEELSLPERMTTTVYHFGFSPETGTIQSYVYRSYNDFVSERLQYGVGRKPECELIEKYEFPNAIKPMMEEQRTIQAALPKDERIHIGGQIIIHHLTAMGFQVYVLDQFSDFAKHEHLVYENFTSER